MGTPRSPATRAPCVARTMSWTVNVGTGALGPLSRQDPPGDLAVVEGEHVGADDLIGLVTLPGDDDRIARRGPAEDRANRARAVGLGREAARGRAGPPYPDADLVDDRLGPLRAWIVGCHPHLVAKTRGDLAHDRALGAVPVAAAPEHHREPAARQLARRRQHALEGVGRVGVVNHDEKRLAGPD